MKARLLAALTLTAAVAVPLLPSPVAPTALAVGCDITGVPVLFPPGVDRLPQWESYSNPSTAVNCLEQRLNELGYSVGTPDGSYSGASVTAMKDFQLKRGYHADGVVSPPLMRQLQIWNGPVPPASAPTVTMLGDSVSAGMRWTDEINGDVQRWNIVGNTYDVKWSIESCRRLVNPSCASRTGRYTEERPAPVSVLPLMKGSMKGQLGQAIIVMAGYDDVAISSAIDQIMLEARAQGVAKVFWLTYKIFPGRNYPYKQYYTQHNANLQAAKLKWPNLVVLDWNTYSAPFPNWFTSDGIHLMPSGASGLANFLKDALDASDVETCVAANANAGVPDPTTGTPEEFVASDTGFTGVDPVRVLDTRDDTLGGGDGKLRGGRTIAVDLSGELPPNTEAAVLNVIAVNPCDIGYLTVFACGVRPDTSNVNYVAARTTAGMAITLHDAGDVCIYSSRTTDIVADLVGAFTTGGALFHPYPGGPERWGDTRAGQPGLLDFPNGPIAGGNDFNVDIAGTGDVPESATAVWLNVTATGSATNAVVQVYPGPCGTAPETSVLNVLANRSAATAVLIELGANGGICMRSFSGSPHHVLDVSGWFGGPNDGSELAFHILTPDRLVDTRPNRVAGGGDVQIDVAADTVGVYNVTAVNSGGFFFVSAEPCPHDYSTSLLNTATNENIANVAAVGPGTGGKACVSPAVISDILVDVTGTFVAADT